MFTIGCMVDFGMKLLPVTVAFESLDKSIGLGRQQYQIGIIVDFGISIALT